MSIPIVVGSYRNNRMGERASLFIQSAMEKIGLDGAITDPKSMGVGILTNRYNDFPTGTQPDHLTKLQKTFSQAQGLLLVSAEYNYSIPPGLSNVLDYFKEEFKRKPFAIASYSMGPFGGVRATEQLRSLISCLGGISLPVTLPIPSIQDKIAEDGSVIDPIMNDFVVPFLEEFRWYVQALSSS